MMLLLIWSWNWLQTCLFPVRNTHGDMFSHTKDFFTHHIVKKQKSAGLMSAVGIMTFRIYTRQSWQCLDLLSLSGSLSICCSVSVYTTEWREAARGRTVPTATPSRFKHASLHLAPSTEGVMQMEGEWVNVFVCKVGVHVWIWMWMWMYFFLYIRTWFSPLSLTFTYMWFSLL